MLLSATLATDYNHSFATMIHPNANLSPNYYTHNDPTSQTFDHPEQVFGDHLHVSHDVSPTCTDSVLAHLSPQEQLTHVRHPYNYYHPSLSLPSSEAELHLDQSRIMALGHGRHMSPVDESPCTSCDPQKFSCPSMSVAMPFSAIRREHSAGSLSIGAASLPSDCTMDDLSFHGAHGMTVSFSSLPNSPQVNSLLAQSYEQQPGWRHYQHGQCQVNSFNSDVTFYDHSKTDTSYQGSSSPGSSECTTESIEEPTNTGGSSSSTATRHPCPVPDCGKSFPRASNLKTHMGTHNTHRPFACTFCDYSFARIHDRDRHMNSHLTLKPFACIVCQTRFARQDAVTRHLKMSAETNICAWLLEAKGLPAKEVAAGRVPRSALGEETEIRVTLERMAEEARTMRMRRTEEMLQKTQDMINGTQATCNTPSN